MASKGQAVRLLIPLDERRTSRVEWWLESLRGEEAVRFQAITPDGGLLDHGAVGALNLGAFPVASAGSYALLLENPGNLDRVFQFTIRVTAR